MCFEAPSAVTFGDCAERGWSVVVACDRCGHVATWSAELLAQMRPAVSTRDIAERLRCALCGGPDGKVFHKPARSARPALVGPA
jgi:hypothetical protein